jgi:hypothetical protein
MKGICNELNKERKEIVARYLQLLAGHGIIAPFLGKRSTLMDAGGRQMLQANKGPSF